MLADALDPRLDHQRGLFTTPDGGLQLIDLTHPERPTARDTIAAPTEEESPVHAVVVHLTITADFDTDTSQLREQVVPAVSHAPGFVAGYWTRKERSGLSVLVFESKDTAQAMSESLASMIPPDAATVDGVEVREVVAHA